MGASLELLDDGQIVVLTTTSPVVAADLMDVLDEGARLAKPGFSVVVDGSGVEDSNLSPDTVRAYVAYFKRRPEQRGQRFAWVPPRGTVNYGFARMTQLLADADREMALFETREEALAWLAQPPSLEE